MQKEIAVVGLTTKFVNPTHSGTVVITSSPNTNVSINSKNVYAGVVNFTITAGTDGSITNATGTGSFITTSTTTQADSQLVLRKGDLSIPVTMTGTNPSPPPPTSTYVTIIEVDDPGQTDVLSD